MATYSRVKIGKRRANTISRAKNGGRNTKKKNKV